MKKKDKARPFITVMYNGKAMKIMMHPDVPARGEDFVVGEQFDVKLSKCGTYWEKINQTSE